MDWSSIEGKVVTARGPVEPAELGAVMMHEHLICDWAQKEEVPFDMGKWVKVEKKMTVPTEATRMWLRSGMPTQLAGTKKLNAVSVCIDDVRLEIARE